MKASYFFNLEDYLKDSNVNFCPKIPYCVIILESYNPRFLQPQVLFVLQR